MSDVSYTTALIRSPIAGDALVTPVWQNFFRDLFERVGGANAPSLPGSATPRQTQLGTGNYNAAVGYPDGSTVTYQWYIILPSGFASAAGGAVRAYLTCTVAGLQANLVYQYFVIRDNGPLVASGFADAAWIPETANTAFLRTFQIGGNTFLPGDSMVFQLQRQGGADANTGIVSFLGGSFDYLGAVTV